MRLSGFYIFLFTAAAWAQLAVQGPQPFTMANQSARLIWWEIRTGTWNCCAPRAFHGRTPVITGRTDLTSGELFYRNVRYQLLRGVITFDDPNRTSPVLNVAVATTVEQYNLTLNLRGQFEKLTTSHTSDPPLPTADTINLIARGKTSAESTASSQSTDSMIASQAASQVSGNIQKLAGISNLTIDPTLGGNNQNPSARVAIQQRVTKNFLSTFSTFRSQGARSFKGTTRSTSVGRSVLHAIS